MKSLLPETRNSLIARLPNPQDADAWDQFVEIYQPLVFRLARSKGFQDADALEITQEVMVAVAGAVERWEPDPERGRFRDWLFRIARNLMIKYLTRKKHKPLGTGDSAINALLHDQSDVEPNSEVLILEHRREVFRWAVEQVREQVTENTWQAFWMANVEGIETKHVAKELGMSVGAIHIACSRVRKRLRDVIEPFQERNDVE
ncbi:MAG TPA: sigma-70 family RNA polymerase sigma factor [Planctomycetaceae bacterium]|nr:sigma-70 family RNA polymerase sigma factor [Planctomycetaceae bacterium]